MVIVKLYDKRALLYIDEHLNYLTISDLWLPMGMDISYMLKMEDKYYILAQPVIVTVDRTRNKSNKELIDVNIRHLFQRGIMCIQNPRICSSVRGSHRAVIMGLDEKSRTAHTTARLASTLPSDMPFTGGSYQSRQEFNNWPVVWEARIMRSFFHFQKLCGTCLWASTAVDRRLRVRGLFTAWP